MTLQLQALIKKELAIVVTHQHSGDPTIVPYLSEQPVDDVVTHQHSGDPTIKDDVAGSRVKVS